jgi:hypothetical protein
MRRKATPPRGGRAHCEFRSRVGEVPAAAPRRILGRAPRQRLSESNSTRAFAAVNSFGWSADLLARSCYHPWRRANALEEQPIMDKVVSLLISVGIITFGAWVATATIAKGWPLVWTLMALFPLLTGFISLYDSIKGTED